MMIDLRFYTIRLLVIVIFSINSFNIANAFGNNNQSFVDSNSTIKEKDSTKFESGNYFLVGAGIISYFSSSAPKLFFTGPAINLGIELPFSSSHIFALQMSGSFWIAKSRNELDEWDKIYYSQLSKNIYTLFSFSPVLKCYLSNNIEKFRISLHLGGMLFSSRKSSRGIELGIAFNYKLNKQCFINLSMTTHRMSFTSDHYLPDLIIFNYFQQFYW